MPYLIRPKDLNRLLRPRIARIARIWAQPFREIREIRGESPRGAVCRPLHVEAEVDHVAVLHDVLLALGAQRAGMTRRGLAAVPHELVDVDHFARMKPRSKSVWITPAAWGAVHPARIVHARSMRESVVK